MYGEQLIYRSLRPFLFHQDPEKAHYLTLKLMKWVYQPWLVLRLLASFPQKPTTLWGLTFPNPVGLAAGFDKDGYCLDACWGLGFGFIEVGAVTPLAQPGNPKPRLFRLLKAQALINRMGFNNLGLDQLVSQLQRRQVQGIVGVNLGKNKTTPLQKALDDYREGYIKVYPYADYVTINISSPNTPMIRELHKKMYLNDLLLGLRKEQIRLEDYYQKHVPLLLKISPDLNPAQLEEVAAIALHHRLEGIVAVNTTNSRGGVAGLPHADEEGGLSGRPLFAKTLSVITALHRLLQGEIPLIAVGGILSGTDTVTLMAAGAQLVQVYTGLIYRGPRLVREIVQALQRYQNNSF